jgi:hypothetical protein
MVIKKKKQSGSIKPVRSFPVNRVYAYDKDRQPKQEMTFQAELRGLDEVPPIFTQARGTFQATVAPDGESIQYELTYSNLSSTATAAHIHFGPKGVNGGIMVFLCGGDDAPSCPAQSGNVTGTITAQDVVDLPEQGIVAGDLNAVLKTMRAGSAYVNVHSTNFPGGEIRGQISRLTT